MTTIYKVCEEEMWRSAVAEGLLRGSPDDARDGFIHFSGAGQLAGTVAKHFANKSSLMLIAVDGDALGPQLRWEPSRGGELFPHLYAALPLSAVRWARRLPDTLDDRAVIAGLEP